MTAPARTAAPIAREADGFCHEAWFYAGEREFVEGISEYVREGLEAGESVLLVVSPRKIALLREALGADAGQVRFADTARLGDNPARIIPAWQDFVSEGYAAGKILRGVGEPIHPGRGRDALVECHRHESLLNVAFAEASEFWLRCPYDTRALDEAVVEEAHRTHPYLAQGPIRWVSMHFGGLEQIVRPFTGPLPDAPARARLVTFERSTLPDVRRAVADEAIRAGLSEERAGDLALAVNEVAGNAVRHGGGRGELRLWADDESVVCEVHDSGGLIDDPLAGRRRPSADEPRGFGLWLANGLCDLVQIRSRPAGAVVRLHMRRDDAGAR